MKHGVIENSVLRHNPSPLVLFEAAALDRELSNRDRSWSSLLAGIESFSGHYPSILLHSPEALEVMGRASLECAQQAPGLAQRAKAAALIVEMLDRVVAEFSRERPQNIDPRFTQILQNIILGLAGEDKAPLDHEQLSYHLQSLGKRVLLVGEDAELPELWMMLLGWVTRLLLKIVSNEIQGEPFYDGRWDNNKRSEELEPKTLEAVRWGRIHADLDWCSEQGERINERTGDVADVFLEIQAFLRRGQRTATWENWFDSMARKSKAGKLSIAGCEELCRAVSDWIKQSKNRQVLSRLAPIWRKAIASVIESMGLEGATIGLEGFGKAIIDRLSQEVGRGETDQSFELLRQIVALMTEKVLEGSAASKNLLAQEMALHLRTGAMVGTPFSYEDAIWCIKLVAHYPQLAKPVLLSLLVGFNLEEVFFRDQGLSNGQNELGFALSNLLGREWPHELIFLVRAVLRVTPLSPFHIGGSSTRAHLFALDPKNQPGFYLHDLKEHVLSGGVVKNIWAVENLLAFWRDGNPKILSGWISAESLATLISKEQTRHLEHIKKLIENLSLYVPMTNKEGVLWLGRMPSAYYEIGTLRKIAGFEGCDPEAISLLTHLLSLYRVWVEQAQQPNSSHVPSGESTEKLLKQSEDLLAQRKALVKRLFNNNHLDGFGTLERLELFSQDASLVVEVDKVLEELGTREYLRSNLSLAASLLKHYWTHSLLSGLGRPDHQEILRNFVEQNVSQEDLLSWLQRMAWMIASYRNYLAESLQPHVQDSANRLLHNPFSLPASCYQRPVLAHREKGLERLSFELGTMLVDDLLSADGGFLIMENFVHRLLHLLD